MITIRMATVKLKINTLISRLLLGGGAAHQITTMRTTSAMSTRTGAPTTTTPGIRMEWPRFTEYIRHTLTMTFQKGEVFPDDKSKRLLYAEARTLLAW